MITASADDPRGSDVEWVGHQPAWAQATQRYPRGVALFEQGAEPLAVWYVVSGTVKLTYVHNNGRESIVGLASGNDWLATAEVVAGKPASVSAITCIETLVARCPAMTFRQLLRDDARLSTTIHKAHAETMCHLIRRIGQLCSVDARERLREVLYRFAIAGDAAPQAGRARRFNLPLQRCELAEFIGVTAEHLSRLFNDMETRGLVRRQKGWLVVDDIERLRDVAEPDAVMDNISCM